MPNRNDARKKRVLEEIKKTTYCRLAPSPISKVGVFAIRDIPENINPFVHEHEDDWLEFDMEELKDLSPAVMKMVEDFCVIEDDGSVRIPASGFQNMGMSFYVNHSKDSNLITSDDGYTFVTKRKIKTGEELLIDYTHYATKAGLSDVEVE